jgi:coenzyme F420-reducing hydrogenase delta subunit
VKGNQLVRKRSDDLSDKLRKMMIEPDRVRFVNLEIGDSAKYAKVMRLFVQELKAMGLNPFKI